MNVTTLKERYFLDAKTFLNTPSAIAIIDSVIQKTSKQARKTKERGLVVASFKNKQRSHKVHNTFQYYILILHGRQSNYNPQGH